jgi:hypothetical protein
MTTVTCHACGFTLKTDSKIGRETLCPSCGVPLHACLNCRFFDKFAHHQCRENQAEFVSDKKFGNFCEYFTPASPGSKTSTDKVEEARKKLEALFKKE